MRPALPARCGLLLPLRPLTWLLSALMPLGIAALLASPPAHGQAAAASTAQPPPTADEPAPRPHTCPSGLPDGTRCLAGRDSAGAHVLIALPTRWSGVLVLHAHGGPELGAPRLSRTEQDLQRWAVVLKAGHAWAGSTYRQGGVAVHAAAEDTERLRRLFVRHVGPPQRTLLHGQSWGASVAAVGAELYANAGDNGRSPYDAVLLTSGVLGGGSRSYDMRLDLRVLYQHLCHNHPAADEPDYPLNIGLPPGSPLTREALAQRADACTGLRLPATQRSAAQQQRLDALLATSGVPEAALLGHLNWATWHFQDVVQQRTGGLSPFGNRGVRYRGSSDDDALNRAVARYTASPVAVAAFSADTDPGGRIPVPVLTVHGIEDPVAYVELEQRFAQTMTAAGTADHLVQTFAMFDQHSYLSDATYTTLLAELLRWVDSGLAPTPLTIARRCKALVGPEPEGSPTAQCRFVPAFKPEPLDSRVPVRERP
jgi:alpha-beta hydrolase superfamily lysophospholipase